MKQPHAIVADDIHNVGSEYPDCTRDVIKFTMRVQPLISEEGAANTMPTAGERLIDSR